MKTRSSWESKLTTENRVLVVEALPRDAELCRREVKRVIPLCELLCLKTRSEYVKALELFQPMLIISDFKLPAFDGLTALELAKAHDRDLPFIFLTDSINEETAVACMKAGAWDYVIKEHIKRLGPAILEALDERHLRLERRTAQQVLSNTTDHWQDTFDAVNDSMWLLSTDHRILHANRSTEEIFGLKANEIIGRHCFEIVHGTEEPIPQCPVVRISANLERSQTVLQVGEKWLEVTADPIVDTLGKHCSTVHLVSDVTEQKQQEHELIRAKEKVEHLNRLLRAFRKIDQLIIHEKNPQLLTDSFCQILIENRGYAAVWIATRGDDGRPQLWAEAGWGEAFDPMAESLQKGQWPQCKAMLQPSEHGLVVLQKDSACRGCPLCTQSNSGLGVVIELRASGRAMGLLGVSLPTSNLFEEEEQKLFEEIAGDIAFALWAGEMERSLRAEQALLREIAANLPNSFISIVAEDLTIVFTSGKEFTKHNIDPNNFLGMTLEQIYGQKTDVIRKHYLETFKGNETTFEMNVGGQHLLYRTVPLRNEDESVKRILVAVENITDRRQAKRNFKKVFNSSLDGIVLADPGTGKFHMVNDTLCSMTGFTRQELDGMGVEDLHPEEDLPRVLEEFSPQAPREKSLALDIPVKRKDGTVFFVEVNTVPIEIDGKILLMGSFRDVTERKQMQASLAQSDRLSSMGMLAAGVAHEINNPLLYILCNLESLMEDIPKMLEVLELFQEACDDKSSSSVEMSKDAIRRMNELSFDDILDCCGDALQGTYRIREIARGLGAFSRVEKHQLVSVDLNRVIDVAVKMAHNEIKYRARLEKDFSKIPMVFASEGRLSQVFLNLIINAFHAIEEGNVERNVILLRTWTEGAQVIAEVHDSGVGIESKHLEKLFEPFFTTRKIGEGAGLGLAISKNIIEEYGGTIMVRSELGKGTTITIRLPVRSEAVCSAQPIVEPDSKPQVFGRILIVDDELAIRVAISRWLRGHSLLQAANGAEAIQTLEKDQSFDLILCDMMMSDISGMELHEWLTAEHPDLARKLVFITGGAFTPRAREYLQKVDNITIEKPFVPAAFLKIVNDRIRSAKHKERQENLESD